MPDYRRLYVSGGTYFFTVALADQRRALLVEHSENLRAAWMFACRKAPFRTLAYVILPDHLHCIWRLPDGDRDFSTRWKILKARFSRLIDPALDANVKLRRGERGVWQRRFWEHHIRDERDWAAHVAYIHDNPVKHGYVTRREDWRLSSWPRYARMATWPEDRMPTEGPYFGEP